MYTFANSQKLLQIKEEAVARRNCATSRTSWRSTSGRGRVPTSSRATTPPTPTSSSSPTTTSSTPPSEPRSTWGLLFAQIESGFKSTHDFWLCLTQRQVDWSSDQVIKVLSMQKALNKKNWETDIAWLWNQSLLQRWAMLSQHSWLNFCYTPCCTPSCDFCVLDKLFP